MVHFLAGLEFTRTDPHKSDPVTVHLVHVGLDLKYKCRKLIFHWIDDTDITLREFGYYIYEVEEFVQRQALLYDPENPKHWWNTHFSAGMDSQFVCDYAKKVAVNICVSDEIYYRLCYDGNEFTSVASLGEDIKRRTILVNGVSKFCNYIFRQSFKDFLFKRRMQYRTK